MEEGSEVMQSDHTNSGQNCGLVRSQCRANSPVSVLSPHVFPSQQRISSLRGFRRTYGTPLTADDLHVAIYDLRKRIQHLIDTCDNHNLFTQKEVWRKRTCGCLETLASLVFCADVKLEKFGELGSLPLELGNVEKIRDL